MHQVCNRVSGYILCKVKAMLSWTGQPTNYKGKSGTRSEAHRARVSTVKAAVGANRGIGRTTGVGGGVWHLWYEGLNVVHAQILNGAACKVVDKVPKGDNSMRVR